MDSLIKWSIVYLYCGNATGRNSKFDDSHDNIKKVVRERTQCFSGKCHISDSNIDKLSFKNPCKDKQLQPSPIMH